MKKNSAFEIGVLVVVLGTVVTLATISVFLVEIIQPQVISAQAIPTEPLKSIVITDETLQAFGLPSDPIHTAATSSFNLQVVKTTNVITVQSGSLITFTISITNHGPDLASGVFFQDIFPAQLQNGQYSFSTGAINNGASDPKDQIWLLDPIPISNTVAVTVTGQLTSAHNITITNMAMITTHNPSAETNAADNSSAVEVGIVGYDPNSVGQLLTYLPIVNRFPTPTPAPIVLAYSENFDTGGPWPEFNENRCQTEHNNKQYWVRLDSGADECFPPAQNENKPESPYRTHGEFEVAVYHSEGQSDAAFGIFINGDGGDDFYFFRILPNNGCSSGGNWELQRVKDGNTSTILSKGCDTAINRGFGIGSTNVLRVAHKTDRQLIVYINGIQVGSITETVGDERTGQATGLYVRSTNKNILIKFDNFKVYKYP